MPSFIRKPYSEAKKLSISNVAMWTHYMQYKMMYWPELGSAIQSKHKYVIERPNCDSSWSGTSVRKYTMNPLDFTALVWNAMPATWTDTPTPSLHSRKMKHSSILLSDPRSQQKPTSFFALILATSQPAITPPRTTSTSSAGTPFLHQQLQRCTKHNGLDLLQPLARLKDVLFNHR
jgi:hypothetical protein